MSRRRQLQSDSLDMLLDTICNTFGGILFVAILVVLMIQSSGQMAELNKPIDASPDEIERIRLELKRQQSELESLELAGLSQQRLIEGFAPEEIRELLHNRNDLRQELIDAKNHSLSLLDKNAEISRENEQKRQVLETAKIHHDQLIKGIDSLKAQLDAAIKQRTQSHSLPVVRENRSRGEIAIIVKYGRMYLWHRYDQFGNRTGLNTQDFVVVDELGDALVTQPLPTGGIRLSYDQKDQDKIRAALNPFNTTRSVMVVLVRTDSFKEFRILRNIIKETGFDYRLIPSDHRFVDRGGIGGQYQ